MFTSEWQVYHVVNGLSLPVPPMPSQATMEQQITFFHFIPQTGQQAPTPAQPRQFVTHFQKEKMPRTVRKVRQCGECGIKETPEFRKGPAGGGTLCNACGLRWSKRVKRMIQTEQYAAVHSSLAIDPAKVPVPRRNERWQQVTVPQLHAAAVQEACSAVKALIPDPKMQIKNLLTEDSGDLEP